MVQALFFTICLCFFIFVYLCKKIIRIIPLVKLKQSSYECNKNQLGSCIEFPRF